VTRKLAPRPHPTWIWSVSGGIDSVAAYLVTREALHENYHGRPLMSHFDTTVGLPLNRFYVEKLADTFGEDLMTLRTRDSFRGWVEENDVPGPGAHGRLRGHLKGRQADVLKRFPDATFILGLRGGESPQRQRMDKAEPKDRCWEVRPVHRLSKRDCAEIILRDETCPINPCWVMRMPSDCWCLANGDPSELDRLEERFPWFAQRLREIEEAADDEGADGLLGHGGLAAEERKAIDAGHEQLSLCSEGCNARLDPPVMRAFRARLDGQAVEECVAILREDDADRSPRPRQTTLPDGGRGREDAGGGEP